MSEAAIDFVVNFYCIPRHIALKYYQDEIEAAEQLLQHEEFNEGIE